MGLGLFLTRSVIELLGGSVDIESQVGKGTRVRVTLPAANGRIVTAMAS
jgi:two-component system cell cycle sensor histidine kinase PleC